MTTGPIFLAGLAHSGKTPLRIALDAHSRIAMTRRTYMWTRYYARFGDLADPLRFERCLGAMMRDEGIRELNPDVSHIRVQFARGEPTYGRLFALFHEQHAASLGKTRWGDQLGMVEAFADRIFEAYPDAAIIHLIRDPRRGGSDRSFRHVGRLGWMTGRWLFSADLAARNSTTYSDRYCIVRYETLTGEPESTLRRIARFVGEEYEPQMLDAVPSPDPTSQELEPAQTTAAFVSRYASGRLDALGYAGYPPHRRLNPSFYMVEWPANRAAMLAWEAFGARTIKRRAQR